LLYGRPEFESLLGTPEEAFYQAEAMRRSRVVLDKILYVCSIIVKM
jgi:hypothetical protein